MSTLKQAVKRMMPASVYRKLKIGYRNSLVLRESTVDALRHIRYSAEEDDLFSAQGSPRNLECQLTKDYHRIEKGLALRTPKRPFGTAVAQRIEAGLRAANVNNALPDVSDHAVTALDALQKWNGIEEIDEWVSPTVSGSTIWDPLLEENAQNLLEHFFSTRHSVRAFDTLKDVRLDDIRRAVQIALATPSVCNRQAWKVHFYTKAQDVARVIGHQNGNAGFGLSVPSLAVITVDMRLFAGAGERHQRWIEGGLFAMSFAYGLHSVGLASCMLNWSMKNGDSERLRASADIEPHEDVVMLMAVGFSEKSFRVARSPRRNVEAVLSSH